MFDELYDEIEFGKTNSSKNSIRTIFDCAMKKKKNARAITMKDIERVWYLPQKQAALELGVCVSTLKRHFYALVPNKKWPYIPYQKRKRQIRQAQKKGIDQRLTIPYICNTKNVNVKTGINFMKFQLQHVNGLLKKNGQKQQPPVFQKDDWEINSSPQNNTHMNHGNSMYGDMSSSFSFGNQNRNNLPSNNEANSNNVKFDSLQSVFPF